MITNQALKSVNPATLEVLGEVPVFDEPAVNEAVARSWQAYETWRLTTYAQRARLVRKLRKEIESQADAIAELVVSEVGKPLAEAYMAELFGPLDACTWFADNSERALKDQIVNLANPMLSSKQSVITFEPIGVVGIISPWNYPFAIPVMTIIMNLMVGNTVVLKPSEKASLTGIKIGDLVQKAGFPDHVLSVVTGERQTGVALSRARLARLIFTGSVAGGRQVMAQASERLTPVSLELGGKDAAIVLPDAPVDWTARALVWGAFTNCGQACASIERVYIVRGKNSDRLIEKIVEHTRALRVGNGADAATDVGPLIDAAQMATVEKHVSEAVRGGARVLCGGARSPELAGHFYQPTVLTGVNDSMLVMREETFGPVLPIVVVDSEDQAVELTNKSDFGLSASVWTGNLGRGEDVARDLDVGTVIVNDCLFSFACPQVPWGGLKKSGSGRTHSYFGLLDLVNIKHISIDAAGGPGRQWWFPYGKPRVEVARGGVRLMHGSNPWRRLSGLLRFALNCLLPVRPRRK